MSILSNKKILFLLFAIVALTFSLLAWGGFFSRGIKAPDLEPSVAIILDWHEFALRAERYSEGFRPPVAARVYAYSGLAAWEAAVPVLGGSLQSLAPRYAELNLPPVDTKMKYHLPTVLNACYNQVFQKLYISAPRNIEQERKELELKWASKSLEDIDSNVFYASEAFGKNIALAVYKWSATDTLGHMANLHNYDRNYSPPSGLGLWQPCEDFPMPALLPHWGETRTFSIKANDFLAAPLPPFSMEPHSLFYVQALEVYTMNSPLSPENKWIAEFWSDDFAGITFSTAGRWISIANQVVKKESPSVERALETYLKLGFAMSDASVACWKSKYHYNLLRPETFIRQTINPEWRAIVHTPSFPAYPSGHAMLSASAAEVLTSLYGQHYEMTDRTHEGRTEFKGTPRKFHSFYEMAFENASSRIPLGVHYRIDCDEGTRLGLAIGKVVAGLPIAKMEQ